MNPILYKVMEIVAEQFGGKIGDLTPDTRFVEDLDESLEFTETVMACEEDFGINIPDEEAVKLVTIGLLAAYIESRFEVDNSVWPPAPKIPSK
jgi:acyl carrier protein